MQTSIETKRDVVVYVTTMILTIAVANWSAVAFLGSSGNEHPVKRHDASALIEFSHIQPGPLQPGPVILLMGNSHTYAMPGMDPSSTMQIDCDDIFIKRVADRIRQGSIRPVAQFHLIARPNLLPFEMLIRAERMYLDGEAPRLVILGLTWRNIARDSQVRNELQELFRDPTFAEETERLLRSLPNPPSREIFAALASEQRRARVKQERNRQKSDGDQFDEFLYDRLGQHLALLGRSADLRSRAYRMLFGLQDAWASRKGIKYTYDLIDSDYAFNRQCLWALLDLFHEHGARVVCYLAPERHDLQPLVDPTQEGQFDELLRKKLAEMDGALLDARQVIPDNCWGWENGSPDRSHFSSAGHNLMAEYLYSELSQRGIWPRLTKP